MKVDFIKKAKWYIIGFILVAIMLSVSLSFCSWDNMSVNLALSKGNSGWFSDKDKMYLLEVDSNNNHIVDVGDIVSFGKYYQDANITTKTPIRWIVVEKENNQLTLLAEKVMAFGNFWGNYYNDGTQNVYNSDWGPGWKWGNTANGYSYQNYSKSTLRAWLNSYFTGENIRNDGGSAFSEDNEHTKLKGFYIEAFEQKERNYILTKEMSSDKIYGKDNPNYRAESFNSISDKVWVPSWTEIYGKSTTYFEEWSKPVDDDWNTYDGNGSAFSYFKSALYNQNNDILKTFSTQFARSQYSNYSDIAATSTHNLQSATEESRIWWWLRSPSPSHCDSVLMVNSDGMGRYSGTFVSDGGVRPAIIIPA